MFISNPTVPTINLNRPLALTFFSLSLDRNPYYSIANYQNKFIFIVMKVQGFKSNKNGNLHTRRNIPWIFDRILNIRNNKFFFLQRCNFNPLNMLRSIYKFNLAFIYLISFEICKVKLFWFHSKHGPSIITSILKSLHILQCFW